MHYYYYQNGTFSMLYETLFEAASLIGFYVEKQIKQNEKNPEVEINTTYFTFRIYLHYIYIGLIYIFLCYRILNFCLCAVLPELLSNYFTLCNCR